MASQEDPQRSDRARLIGAVLLAVVLLVHVALAWLGRPPGITTGQDDAQYLMLGQSLRQGGYHELFRVDLPVHALYPPGYPALLALWGWPTGDRFDALVGLSVLLSVTSLLLLHRILRRRLDETTALVSVALLAVSPLLVRIAGSINSEIALVAASVAALFCLSRAADESGRPAETRWLVLAGAAAIYAALSRVVGVTLLAAVALHWALERRWRAVGWLTLAGALTVGAWLAWTAVAPDQHVGVSYASDLTAGINENPWVDPLPGRIPHNLEFYARSFLTTLSVPNLQATALDWTLGLAVAALLLVLGLRRLSEAWRPGALYATLCGGLLAVWTFTESRYLTPLLVVLLPAVVTGAHAVARRVVARQSWPVALVLLALFGGAAFRRSAAAAARNASCERSAAMPAARCVTPGQAAYFDALRWIERETPPNAVILSAKYAPLYYYTGRKTPSYRGALSRGSDGILPFLDSLGVRHILFTGLLVSEHNRLIPRLAANCRRLAIERHFAPRVYLFTVLPDEASGEGACRAIDGLAAAGPPGSGTGDPP
ncbi:MAG: glycosyltransferase family 39 protein [Gemmatimonadales bacterium]